ncbi:malto-oligosyltrehalose trehalohydrolase [Propylenella binzhouense]|uniref:Malto-oligosyltrehalose trehalohydrolase n=1 Tax=Propylenella binzhouense TaxID=2555902 RepID=A0A964WTE5_9HYPH|nr:malto-oligosyltrehalose trehalohydrolase [Propylenella binzhouense]MYZ47947.1 malto-oligosyltrehalose trehalohydrolase [Propylenella binzhouense]
MTRFRFETSWGAIPTEGGGARFRIWAPSHSAMTLRAEGRGDLPMRQAEGGWFELETDAVPVGGGYRFVLPDGFAIPDPAARAQIGDVHGPSRLVDPKAHVWRTADWKGRPWGETVFYELHTGTFTGKGTFDGVNEKLDYLAELGVTAVELMPVAQFGGNRGWGYDGVLLYAPHPAYGGPERLKALVDAAHERGLMMFLDVVYNHFGPDGSYLHLVAPDFFHPERQTPWGGAIAYEKPPVRDFFIENALYWLEEFRFDGLRLDAIDQIDQDTEEPLLEELALTVRSRITDREIHLTTEDDRNITRLHVRDEAGRIRLYDGEWNDDFHHAAHVMATHESEGYYADYTREHAAKLAKALATGFVFQGEPSVFRDNEPRGEPSAILPPTAFVNFLQNHDQIGNRAFNERLTMLAPGRMLELLTAILLLSPQIPLLFMGEEWAETRSFGFFTDFHGELGDAVREGRRNEFRKWPQFASEENRARIPDPNAETTFTSSRMDWSLRFDTAHARRLDLVKRLLKLRRDEIAPRLAGIGGNAGAWKMLDGDAFLVRWLLGDGSRLSLYANFEQEVCPVPDVPDGRLIFDWRPGADPALREGKLPPLSVAFYLEQGAKALPNA